jgi:pyrimidine deaminase RibD-like protein
MIQVTPQRRILVTLEPCEERRKSAAGGGAE